MRSWRARAPSGSPSHVEMTTSAQRSASSSGGVVEHDRALAGVEVLVGRAAPLARRRRDPRAEATASARRRAARRARRRRPSPRTAGRSTHRPTTRRAPAPSDRARAIYPTIHATPRAARTTVPRHDQPMPDSRVTAALWCAAWIWGSASPARSTTSSTPCSPRSSATRTCGSPTARCCGRTATPRWRWPPAARRGSRSAPASPSPAPARSAVTAAAHATINRLAPGRVFCAVGSGNTANRVMGAQADADRRVRALHRRAARPARRRGGRRRVPRRHPAGPPPHARRRVRRLRAAHPAVRLRVRAAGDGPRRAPRRRARDVGAADASTGSSGRGPASMPRPPTPASRSTASTFLTVHADDDGRAAARRDAGVRAGPAGVRRVRHRRPALPVRAVEGGRPARPPRRASRAGTATWRCSTPSIPSGCTSASTRATTAGSSTRSGST